MNIIDANYKSGDLALIRYKLSFGTVFKYLLQFLSGNFYSSVAILYKHNEVTMVAFVKGASICKLKFSEFIDKNPTYTIRVVRAYKALGISPNSVSVLHHINSVSKRNLVVRLFLNPIKLILGWKFWNSKMITTEPLATIYGSKLVIPFANITASTIASSPKFYHVSLFMNAEDQED